MKKIKRLRINLLLNYPLGVELAFFVVHSKKRGITHGFLLPVFKGLFPVTLPW